MANDDKKLCPYKKTVEREYSGKNGRYTLHERFEVCAGERCMAYRKGPFDSKSQCLRLEGCKE